MERIMFKKIATSIQKVWELITTERRAYEENTILSSLRHIQASIAGLQQKYEGIQVKAIENNAEMTCKLNEIQATTTRLEDKHEAIERTVKEAPKTYADIIKASTTNTKEKAIAEMRSRQRQQRETLRQKRAKYEVTLTMKETNDTVKELINTMPPKEITERCQQKEKASIPGIKLQRINKLVNGIRVRCATEDQAKQLRTIDWSEAFEGIKTHEPKYGIVINGMPIDDLDLEDPKTIKLLEAANERNHLQSCSSPTQRQRTVQKNKAFLHCDLSEQHPYNKCITNGCYINYLHYMPERFIPQFQIMQCYNCCEYGHRAANCKRKPRCGKCAGNHNTKECNNTTAHTVRGRMKYGVMSALHGSPRSTDLKNCGTVVPVSRV